MAKMSTMALAFAIAAASSGYAQASLVLQDSPVFGNGALVEDTSTGLEFLGEQFTAGLSRSQVLSLLATPGGQFSGFRYATDQEVVEMLEDAGIYVFANVAVEDYQPVVNLVGLLEDSTVQPVTSGQISGMTGTTYPYGDIFAFDLRYVSQYVDGELLTAGGANSNLFISSAAAPSIFSFVVTTDAATADAVTTAVPEPSAAAMFLVGAFLVGGFAKSRRR